MKEKEGNSTEARTPSGGGVAGAVIGIDWGQKKKHVAVVLKPNSAKAFKFKDIQEFIRKIRRVQAVGGEAAGPYLAFCRLYDAYGDGKVFCVDPRLVKQYRQKNGIRKTDENDARAVAEILRDFLNGKISEGVWPFKPDPLKRAVREAESLFKDYQRLQSLDGYIEERYGIEAVRPEAVEELKRKWQEKVKEVETLAKEDEGCEELRSYLNGFGETGASVAVAITELKGKRFGGVKKLCAYARENRRLRHAVDSLTEVAWRSRKRSRKAAELVERAKAKTKRALWKWILVRAAWAAGALRRPG